MLVNSIFTTYLQIFINLFMIFLWGWAIIFSLSHVFHHKKMIWGILGATILWLLTMSEFIVTFPKTILILLPNVAFIFKIIETVEQYRQYIQPYYIQELIIIFSIIFILVSILKEERDEEQEKLKKIEKLIEKVDKKGSYIEHNPQFDKEDTFAEANEKTFIAPTVPDFDTERDIQLLSKGKEKPQKVLRAYNTINTIALSPIEQDVTVNASELMKEQERKEKEERFRQFSYEADSTLDQQIQKAERDIHSIELKQSQNLFSFVTPHLTEQEINTNSETKQEELPSEISEIEDTIIQNETSEIKQEEIEDTIIQNETSEIKQEELSAMSEISAIEDTIVQNETNEIEDTIVRNETTGKQQDKIEDTIAQNEKKQDNNLTSTPDEPSELSSQDYLSAENITAISNNELKVADTLDTLDIIEDSNVEHPIQLPDTIEEFTPETTEKNEDSESVSIETIENLATTTNTEKNDNESVSIETIENLATTTNTEKNDNEEVELQTVVEIADFDYKNSSDSESDEDSLMTVIETNVNNTPQEPHSLLGALTTHNNDVIKLKKFSK